MQIQRSDVENNNRYVVFLLTQYFVFVFVFYSADIIDSFWFIIFLLSAMIRLAHIEPLFER